MSPNDIMMKGATPLKQNQGTKVHQQKIKVLAMPKYIATDSTDLHR